MRSYWFREDPQSSLMKSGRFGDPQSRHRKASYTEMEAEVKVTLPQAKEHQDFRSPPKAGRGQKKLASSGFQGSMRYSQQLEFRLLVSRIVQ